MGPLKGYKIIEIAGLGPAPFAGMMLSDMGADVLRIERPISRNQTASNDTSFDILARGRQSLVIDLKEEVGTEITLSLISKADGLIEGFRPGVMERLGLSPEQCFKKNKKLIYGRMTGWGQDGPMASYAGHDINYIALTGALHAIGRNSEKPVPPLNLIGDFGGGGMFLAFGMVCALLETTRSGKGQIIDAAMVDGVSTLMAMHHGLLSNGSWQDKRASNFLDGASHFYDTYECLDGKFIAIGSIEPKFYNALLEKVNLKPDGQMKNQMDKKKWPAQKRILADIFRKKTRDEWCVFMEDSDICFSPVLSITEARENDHLASRQTLVTDLNGVIQPAPAPRFSRTPGQLKNSPKIPGTNAAQILSDWGYTKSEIKKVLKAINVDNSS